MLKLPNRFCRYLKVTCESVSYTLHVRDFTQFACVQKAHSFNPHLPTVVQSNHISEHYSQLASSKIKISSFKNESFSPTPNHVSCGGQFEVNSVKSSANSSNMWAEQYDPEPKNVDSVPEFRIWEPMDTKRTRKVVYYDTGHSLKFKVLSYNVLAQYLLESHPYLYQECAPQNLVWMARSARLKQEILRLAPDIICLQEVEVQHLNSFYSKFEDIGYVGIFKQKTGQREDGCAIYYRRSMFEMVDQVNVEFFQPELPLLNRDNIGILVKLVPRASPDVPFVVATTHLLYNPSRTDVRLAQIKLLLAEIDRFAYCKNGTSSGHVPIILTGDLNSKPDSAVIRLLNHGQVRVSPYRDNSDWRKIGITDNCQHISLYLDRRAGRNTAKSLLRIQNTDLETHRLQLPEHVCPRPRARRPPAIPRELHLLFNGDRLAHRLRLAPVYDYLQPGVTTFQDGWCTVDYIYYSVGENALRVVDRLRLPTAWECAGVGPLPSADLPSDHLALAATFELRLPVPQFPNLI